MHRLKVIPFDTPLFLHTRRQVQQQPACPTRSCRNISHISTCRAMNKAALKSPSSTQPYQQDVPYNQPFTWCAEAPYLSAIRPFPNVARVRISVSNGFAVRIIDVCKHQWGGLCVGPDTRRTPRTRRASKSHEGRHSRYWWGWVRRAGH